jgi:hypothetical protein
LSMSKKLIQEYLTSYFNLDLRLTSERNPKSSESFFWNEFP